MSELYTLDMARRDFTGDNGLELSIRRWESLLDVLIACSDVTDEYCGLCLETSRKAGYAKCEECQFYEYHGDDCLDMVNGTREVIDKACDHAEAILELLLRCKRSG